MKELGPSRGRVDTFSCIDIRRSNCQPEMVKGSFKIRLFWTFWKNAVNSISSIFEILSKFFNSLFAFFSTPFLWIWTFNYDQGINQNKKDKK